MTVKKWKHSGTKKHSMSDREIRNGLLSEKAAEEGIVLLKNDKKILPLNISTKIGLYGAGAGKTVKGGTGSGDVNNRSNISIYQGLKENGIQIVSEKWLANYESIYAEARRAWKEKILMRAFGILLLGGVMIVFQFTAEKQKQKEQRKKEIRQMQFDYPQLINKFSLYIGAGMTVRRAWIQIVKEYDKEKHYLGERTVYEEMRYTMNELKNGRPESECYEAFGRRCESPVYRKFGMLLSQNLRKGTKGLTNLLQREAQEAFEERKNMAKKLGEEAGTKLMIPLFLMLAVVFVIVTVPAFLTIQI